MDTAQKLFREYLNMRSRMVVYIAIALTLLGVFSLLVLIASTAQNINRFGLVLEWLAVLSVVPHVFGLRRAAAAPQAVVTPQPGDPEDAVVVDGVTGQPIPQAPPAGAPPEPAPAAAPAPPLSWEAEIFRYYQSANVTIVMGNIIAALGAIWLMVTAVLNPASLSFPEEAVLRMVISLVGFIWLNLFMLVQILRLVNAALPGGILASFFTVDFLLSFIGVVFAGLIHIFGRWLGRGLGFIFRNGARRVLLAITLPFLLAGLAMQIAATFLP